MRERVTIKNVPSSLADELRTFYDWAKNPQLKILKAIASVIAHEHRLKQWRFVEEHGCYEWRAENCTVLLMPRPYYCDRGDWLMQVESHDVLKIYIDDADGFPRYYFGLDVAMQQAEAWLKARGEIE